MPTGRLHCLHGKHMVHGGWGMVSAWGERLHSCQTFQRYCKQIVVGMLALSLHDCSGAATHQCWSACGVSATLMRSGPWFRTCAPPLNHVTLTGIVLDV